MEIWGGRAGPHSQVSGLACLLESSRCWGIGRRVLVLVGQGIRVQELGVQRFCILQPQCKGVFMTPMLQLDSLA